MASLATPRSLSTGVLEDRDDDSAIAHKEGLAEGKDDGDVDLDAALDDILGGRAKRARPIDQSVSGRSGMPSRLVEEDVDWTSTDPSVREMLSTSNPRWRSSPYELDPAVIDVLSSRGITHFTPVQAEAFAPVLARRDVIGRSRTGTGKTLAFGLPSLTRLVKWTEAKGKRDPRTGQMARGRSPSMLVLCPTRELARQVSDELSSVAKPLGMFVDVFHGGVSYDPQARALRMGVDVVVGTPGRIIDHIDRGNLDLTECDVVVLDEADEMLNMGFAEDVEVSCLKSAVVG
jgi:ATP-dependent RNA helicase DDX21